MAKHKIPVYDICNLSRNGSHQYEFLIDKFSAYLDKHYDHLHTPHRHSFYHLVLFIKGSGSHSIDFNQYPVKPFQLYCMAPGQVHGWNFKDGVDGYIVNFSETFFSSFLANPNYLERFDFFSGISDHGVKQLPPSVHQKAIQLLEELLPLKNASQEAEIDLIRLLLLQLFHLIQHNNASPKKRAVPQQKQTMLRHFQQLIGKYYRTMKLPKEYADLLYITPNHLNALCKDLLGKSAGEIIRDRIVLEGKRLLTNADMTVAEIAYDLNFQDNSYFNRFFKKYTGITPDDFRKQFIIK